jgi:CysZ protein
MATAVGRPIGAGKQFLAGVGLLGRGLAMYGRSPALLLLGIIPAVISSFLILAVLGTVIYFIGDLASATTWFADGWSGWQRDTVRVIAGISIVGVGGLLAVVTFTSITLAIGEPFYEKISERVEDQLGADSGTVDLPFWSELVRGIGESIRLVAMSAAFGIPLFLAGFIPGIGQTVVPVIGALVGGWFLAVELVGVPFARRGLKLRDRRAMLKGHRPLAVGFGAAVFACFLIPLGAVLVMPAAVAGGTLLARRILDATPAPAAAPEAVAAWDTAVDHAS